MKLEVELDKVGEEGVQVGVELEENNLLEVGVVDVGNHVEKEAVELLNLSIKCGGKLEACKSKV